MQDFRKVQAWQKNRELTVLIYKVTAGFPTYERFGLTAQMRRAVVSIGANIAEGCGRGSDPDKQRFFQISFGSAVELLHHIITSLDLGFITQSQFDELDEKLESVRRLIFGFVRKLRSSPAAKARG